MILHECQCGGCQVKHKPAVGIVEDTTGVQMEVCQFHYECAIENGWRDVTPKEIE